MMVNNFKKGDAGCDRYGPQRLELALYLKNNILNKLSNDWFIENGTLLGAWRNGLFIPHDDDFDIAMLITSMDDIGKIYNQIQKHLVSSKYKARLVDTYSSKIEIFDESYGKYILLGETYHGSDFHYVTLDIQFYLKKGDEYERLYYNCPCELIVREDILLPLSTIKLEDEYFNAPLKPERFLKNIYGSLDKNAKYNSKTGLYEL
jgi:phosphorylcholine metabolism protein LicD